ncbi:MAG: hypothetical protein Q9218_002105 [Villophora microphyllina]
MRTDFENSSLGQAWNTAMSGRGNDGRSRTRLVAIASLSIAVFLILVVYAFSHLSGTQKQSCPAFNSTLTALSQQPAAPPEITKIATIMENRPLANLVPIILAFSSVLGQGWPLRIFHSPQNELLLKSSPPIQRMINSGQLTLQELPDSLEFGSHEPVSAFLATPWLWEHLAPAKHVLMFQTDSILCANSNRRVDDFLDYDFIGAPINTTEGKTFNGGLSIRNRETVLEVLKNFNRQENGEFEDQWFTQRMRELPARPDGKPFANLPTLEIAKQFAVETIWHEKPFGMHQVSRWHPEELEKLNAWCPEYQIAAEGGLHPNHKENQPLLNVAPAEGPDADLDVIPWRNRQR